MKKILAFFGLLFFALRIYGQIPESVNPDKKDYSGTEPQFTLSGSYPFSGRFFHQYKIGINPARNPMDYFAKTRKQKLDSTVFQTWDQPSGQLVNGTKDEFIYNFRGNNIQKTVFLWDKASRQWIRESKDDFTCDNNGNITQNTWSHWDKTGNLWVAETKNDFTYDANNNMTRVIFSNWDKTAGKWANRQKVENTYDAKGYKTQQIKYIMRDAAPGQWIADEKEAFTYDAKGNTTEYSTYKWDETLNQWLNISKTEYTFDTGNNLTRFINYRWDKPTVLWVNDQKVEYTYDPGGNNTQNISFTWNTTTGQWVNSSKSEFTYDTGKNIILLIFSQWNKTSGQWVNNSKSEYSYDTRRNLTKNILNKWNSTSGQWVPDTEYKFSYDANGNRFQFIYSKWDKNTGLWVINIKTDNSFDGSFSSSDLIIPDYYLFAFINDTVFNKVTGIVTYEKDQQTPVSRHIMYYSDFNMNKDTVRASFCEGKIFTFRNKNYSKAGFYPDTLVSSMGYDSIVTLALTVHPVFQPKVQVNGDTLLSVDTYPSYQWYNESGKIAGAVSKTYTITKSGKYQLQVTDGNGCTNSSSVTNAHFSDSDITVSADLTYSIIPNPNSGSFTFRIGNVSTNDLKLKLLNLAGQTIEEREVRLTGSSHAEYFNIPHVGKGIYLLKIFSGHGSESFKIIIQ